MSAVHLPLWNKPVFFLVSAWLQEEIWSHQKQVDLDVRQTWLHQCCQKLFATEWCECFLLIIIITINIQHCLPNVALIIFPKGWVQVWQRDDEGLCDTCRWWQVNHPGYEKCRNGQLCKSVHIFLVLWYNWRTFSHDKQLDYWVSIVVPSRWNTKRSMKRQRATTCLSRTLLKSSMPKQCALWRPRQVSSYTSYAYFITLIIHILWALNFHPQSKYKEASKKEMQCGSFTTLSETRDTAHSKEINKLVSGVRVSLNHSTRWTQPSHHPGWPVTFLFLVTESVQSEVWEGKGQVGV